VKRFPNRNETALRSAPEDRERSVCLTVQNLTGSHEIVQRLGWWAAGFARMLSLVRMANSNVFAGVGPVNRSVITAA